MIISKNIKLKVNLPLTNLQIDNELAKLGLSAVRWAVIDIDKNVVTLKISYEKQDS